MPPDPSPDALLVGRARAGDRTAWAELYERYADRLHDYAARLTGSRTEAGDCVQDAFVLAVQRIGQLRDPEKVRPWLYAIVRSTAHRHYRRVDRWAFGDVPDDADAGPGDDAVIAGLTAGEVAALVAEAAAGLTDDDRELLDLSLRHELVPAEIAAALGVSSNHAAVTTERMRERLGRAITVTVLARRPECVELAALVTKEGPLSPLSRKRLARHVDGCPTCGAQAARQVRPDALLAAVPLPLLLLPRRAFAAFATEIDAALRAVRDGAPPADGGLDWGADGFPLRATSRRRRGWLVAAAVAGGLILGGVLVGGVGDGGAGDGREAAEATAATASTAATRAPDATEGSPAASDDGSASDGPAGGTGRPPGDGAPGDEPVGAGHGDAPAGSQPEGPSSGDAGPRPAAPVPAAPESGTDPSADPTGGTTTRPPTASTAAPAAETPAAPTSTPTSPPPTVAPSTAPTPTAPPSTVPPAVSTTVADTSGPTLGAVLASVSDVTVTSGGTGICKQPPTYTTSYPTTATVSVTATDVSGVATVSFTWTTGAASGGGAMSAAGGGWTASLGPLDPSAAPLGGSTGEVTFPLSVTVTATDGGGRTATTTRSGLLTVHNCYVIL